MTRTLAEFLRPPTENEICAALKRFAADARAHYGDTLQSLWLFGSRARGDHHSHSDIDVAMVLRDGDWLDWRERDVLSDLSYERLVDVGADIQGWPVRLSEWLDPERHHNPSFLNAMRRDAKPIS